MVASSTGTQDYPYGMQGQSMTDELLGEGNWADFKYRGADPRLGRFFSVDPLTKKYPWYTPYQFSGNKVINCVELEGLEEHELGNGPTVKGPINTAELGYMKTMETHVVKANETVWSIAKGMAGATATDKEVAKISNGIIEANQLTDISAKNIQPGMKLRLPEALPEGYDGPPKGTGKGYNELTAQQAQAQQTQFPVTFNTMGLNAEAGVNVAGVGYGSMKVFVDNPDFVENNGMVETTGLSFQTTTDMYGKSLTGFAGIGTGSITFYNTVGNSIALTMQQAEVYSGSVGGAGNMVGGQVMGYRGYINGKLMFTGHNYFFGMGASGIGGSFTPPSPPGWYSNVTTTYSYSK